MPRSFRRHAGTTSGLAREELAARIRGLHVEDLDISRKIVVDHGARLTFESEASGGTTFRIVLPEVSRPLHGRSENE